MSFVELSLYLLLWWNLALHPRMGKNLRHWWPVWALKLKHTLDQVLKLLTEVSFFAWFVLAVGSPENVSSVSSQTPVEWVIWLGGGEWWMLSNHDEQNDRWGEKIYRFSLVWLFEMDFWCHVVECTELGVEIASTISSLDWSSKTEICYLENVVLIEEKVLWFEISVRESVLMAVIETAHELFKVVSCDVLLKPSWYGNEVEKFSSEGQFEDNIADSPALSRQLLVLSSASLNLSDDILMLEALECLHLCHHQFLVLLWHILVHHFDSHLSARLAVNTQLNFATGAWTEGSKDLESTDLSWHSVWL